MDASICIALGTFIITLITLLLIFEQRNERKIAARKALVRARGYVSSDIGKIRVWNDGMATAKNIRFVSEDIKEGNEMCLLENGVFPYPTLSCGDSFETLVSLQPRMIRKNPRPKVTIVWDDDFKKDNESEQIMEFN